MPSASMVSHVSDVVACTRVLLRPSLQVGERVMTLVHLPHTPAIAAGAFY